MLPNSEDTAGRRPGSGFAGEAPGFRVAGWRVAGWPPGGWQETDELRVRPLRGLRVRQPEAGVQR